MRVNNHHFWLCLAGTILLAAGVIFLPRYISRSLDIRTWNQVEVSKREDFSFLEQGSNDVFDAYRAFQYLGTEKGELTLLTEINDPIQVNKELLDEVYLQAMIAFEYGMLPWIESGYLNMTSTDIVDANGNDMVVEEWRSWIDDVQSAKYYSLTYESKESPNKKELLNFWYLYFSNGRNYDYYFIVNAVNYQIYYAEIHDVTAQEIVSYSSVPSFMISLFSQGCADYYQVGEYDYVDQDNLYQKLGIAILYDEDDIPLYIEKSEAVRADPHMYRGICVGFQDLIRWVRTQIRENQLEADGGNES